MARFVRFEGVDGRPVLINLDLVKDFTINGNDPSATDANQVDDDFIAVKGDLDEVAVKVS